MIAREMILGMGLGRRFGPEPKMHVVNTAVDSGSLLRNPDMDTDTPMYFHHAADLSTREVKKRSSSQPTRPIISFLFSLAIFFQARIALAEVIELLEAAEAKACYGLAINWKPLQQLVQALLDRGVLQGNEVRVYHLNQWCQYLKQIYAMNWI